MPKTDEEKNAELEAAAEAAAKEAADKDGDNDNSSQAGGDDQSKKKDGVTEPEDNAVRSELGRKVKTLEGTVMGLVSKLDILIEQTAKKEEPEEDDDDDDSIPQTRQELQEYINKTLNKRDKETSSKEEAYNTDYIATINGYKENEDFGEICQLLEQKYNVRRSNDGKLDAKLNFLEAATQFYKTKSGAKGNPLKGKDNDLPLGKGSAGDNDVEQEEEMPTLDAAAREYVQRVGLSEDTVKRAMKRELPPGIAGVR